MFMLSKKDTPKQFLGMWYSGLLNLVIGSMNLYLFVLAGTWFTLFASCISISVAIFIFVMIKRKTQVILMNSLTRA